MTAMVELKRLNRLIRQYETVCSSTPDPDQRTRIEGEIRELLDHRERIAGQAARAGGAGQGGGQAEDIEFPFLCGIESGGARAERRAGWARAVRVLALYLQHFAREFLPVLAAHAADARYSRQRDALSAAFRSLDGELASLLEEQARAADAAGASPELRRRLAAHARALESEAAAFFGSLETFCDTLAKDARGEAVAEMEDFASEAAAYLDVPRTRV